jgi:hypothetical protein
MFPYTMRNVFDIIATRCVNKIRLDLLCSISVNGLVEATVVSTFSLSTLTTVGKCVGLNRRSLRRVVCQRQMLDAKQDGKH